MAQNELQRAVDEMRVSDAIVVFGAGASFQAGMPLGGQLPPLVWHTLDAHPSLLRQVATVLGVSLGSAKETVGDAWERLRVAFAQIAMHREARRTFQHSFTSLNRDRSAIPSTAHTALARLVHAGRVLRVVSLNWDTLLETAFLRRYGIDINSQGVRLWKPHGDCSRPDEDWVLPHEVGVLPDSIVADVTVLANERPRTLLIVGYSERDEAVVQRLIEPLTDRWRVFRVGPRAVGEGSIRVRADDALLGWADALSPQPDVAGWEFVTFNNQRGIEAAITGERLGPRDVESCPRLPQIESARRTLDVVHSVNVAGHSGCGKSITVWQLAHDFNTQGWSVLRPTGSADRNTNALIHTVTSSGWKRVFVLDDSQTFPTGFLEALSELASPTLKVISGTTDAAGERLRSVRIPAKIAVETIAKDFRRRRADVLSVVHQYDPRVGDQYLDTPLERRIDDAAKSDSPWQFAFVLRGGWSQVREQLNALRDFDRADLLLVLVAARQLLSLDAGVDSDVVVADSEAMGRTEQWVRSSLDLLRRQGAILPIEPLRCLHI